MNRGRPRIDAQDKRRHGIGCRLTDAELAACDSRRGGVARGEWLRAAAFGAPIPAPIPTVNRELWVALAPLAGNLNQLARRLNSGDDLARQIVELRAVLGSLRRVLIDGEGIDDDHTDARQNA